jgi:hypothetical protein
MGLYIILSLNKEVNKRIYILKAIRLLGIRNRYYRLRDYILYRE